MTRMRSVQGLALALAAAAATASCGDVVRQGRSPVFLVINSLTATPGGGIDEAHSIAVNETSRALALIQARRTGG